MVARQASNISLFTDNNSADLGELSARSLEWIERLQKKDRTASGTAKPKRKCRSTAFSSLNYFNDPSHLSAKPYETKGPEIEKKQTISLPSVLQKPSRGIIMIRRRSCSLQIRDMLSKENNGKLLHDCDEKYEVSQGVKSLRNGKCASNRGDSICPLQKLENIDPKTVYLKDAISGVKENSMMYEGILRPDPIGKHNDASPSISIRKVHHSTSCPAMDVQGADAWNALTGLHRPEPIGQEDVAKAPDIRATVLVPSSSCSSFEADDIQRLERRSNGLGEREKNRKGRRSVSGKQQNGWLTAKQMSCPVRLFRRKIADVPGYQEGEDCLAATSVFSKSAFQHKRSVVGTNVERKEVDENDENNVADTICSSGFFRALSQNMTRVRRACFPAINTRTAKVTSIKEPPKDKITETYSVSPTINRSVKKAAPSSYSEPVSRKPFCSQSGNSNMVSESSTDLSPRRHTYGGNEKSYEDDQAGKKRKKVEMWLQRQQCRPLHLRGQIKHITHWNMVLFIGTPMYVCMTFGVCMFTFVICHS